MKSIKLRNLLLFCFILLLLFGIIAYATHNPPKGYSHFTNPTKIHEMPADWIKQPIKYEPSVGDADIVIALDQHLYPALLPAIQKYSQKHGLKIVVVEGTCGITAGRMERKEADIGGLCCSPGLTDRLPGLRFDTVGVVAVALLVHPTNPIDNVTFEQARQIFMGDISHWDELRTPKGGKGPNKRIQPVTRFHCKIRPAEWRLLLESEDLFSPDIQEVGAIPDMISQVAKNPWAIGYEVLWHTVRHKEKGEVKALKIDGYSPYDQEDLLSGRYPLYRVYTFITWEGKSLENPKAKKLFEYLLKEVEHLGPEHNTIPASRLRKAGWKFFSNELIGKPE